MCIVCVKFHQVLKHTKECRHNNIYYILYVYIVYIYIVYSPSSQQYTFCFTVDLNKE